MSYDAVLFDFEALGKRPSSVVLDLSAVVFNLKEIDNFDSIVNDDERTFRAKFSVKDQVERWHRKIDKGTLEWWGRQSEGAQKILRPNKYEDLSLVDGMELFREFVTRHDIFMNKKKLAYVRGQSYDFPIMTDIVDQIWPELAENDCFPVHFWNQRDVRTAISHDLMTLNNTKCPLPKGLFGSFVAHNSLHDSARDVISLQHAWAYKTGQMDIPDEYEMY